MYTVLFFILNTNMFCKIWRKKRNCFEKMIFTFFLKMVDGSIDLIYQIKDAIFSGGFFVQRNVSFNCFFQRQMQ